MLVGELIKVLQKLPEDALVVLSKDAEGNCYSPMCAPEDCYSNGLYYAHTTCSGEFASEDDEEYFVEMQHEYPEAVEAICLWPIN